MDKPLISNVYAQFFAFADLKYCLITDNIEPFQQTTTKLNKQLQDIFSLLTRHQETLKQAQGKTTQKSAHKYSTLPLPPSSNTGVLSTNKLDNLEDDEKLIVKPSIITTDEIYSQSSPYNPLLASEQIKQNAVNQNSKNLTSQQTDYIGKANDLQKSIRDRRKILQTLNSLSQEHKKKITDTPLPLLEFIYSTPLEVLKEIKSLLPAELILLIAREGTDLKAINDLAANTLAKFLQISPKDLKNLNDKKNTKLVNSVTMLAQTTKSTSNKSSEPDIIELLQTINNIPESTQKVIAELGADLVEKINSLKLETIHAIKKLESEDLLLYSQLKEPFFAIIKEMEAGQFEHNEATVKGVPKKPSSSADKSPPQIASSLHPSFCLFKVKQLLDKKTFPDNLDDRDEFLSMFTRSELLPLKQEAIKLASTIQTFSTKITDEIERLTTRISGDTSGEKKDQELKLSIWETILSIEPTDMKEQLKQFRENTAQCTTQKALLTSQQEKLQNAIYLKKGV